MAHFHLSELDGTFLGIFESESITWKRNLFTPGFLVIEANAAFGNHRDLLDAMGKDVSIVDDETLGHHSSPDFTYTIESISIELDNEGVEVIQLRGREHGLIHRRVCLPPPFDLPSTDSHHEIIGPMETAMKDIVDKNVGPGAIASRQVSGLAIEADLGRGESGTWRVRLRDLAETLETWGILSGLGWEVIFDPDTLVSTFTIIPERDRSASVIFDVEMDNVVSSGWSRNKEDLYNLAYVGGQGEEIAREIAEVWTGDNEPTGYARREMFVDARDESDATALPVRGRETLLENTSEENVSVEISPVSNRRYREHWDLGDLVTVRNRVWGLDRTARIIAVENSLTADTGIVQRSVTLDKAIPTLRDRVRQETGDIGTRRT